jgi:D-lactate dehydrogenase (cytochrome)
MMLAGSLLKSLRPDQVSTARAVLEQHARGESYDQAVLPEVVVFPESTAKVQAVVRYAYAEGVGITPVGANSSLEGHTVPVEGGISLDLSRMNRILEARPEDLLVVVQPGVTYPQVNERMRPHGLFFPIDPGAHATIGGMVATNASGTAAVRYGVTADYVLALELVTADGRVVRCGSRARKSASGYNLARLLCGSEGTLGIITEVTLRLVGLPEAASAARVPFADALSATSFVTALIQAGVPVARCELIDAKSVAAVNRYRNTAYPEEMTVFLEFHGNPPGVAADAALARELAEAQGALAFEASTDPEERARLWEARHSVFYAKVAANPGRRSLVTDVAVPISRLPEAVTSALADCEREGLNAYLVGHVGDGNFHLAIFFDDDPAALARVEAVTHAMVMRALEVGGTCTGEHGIGLRKRKYMAAEHGEALALMRAVKQAFDPKGIMNPGKKLP